MGALLLATALGSAAIGLLLSSVISRAWAVVLLAYFAQFAVYFVLPILVSVLYSQISPRQQSMTAMAAANPMWTALIVLVLVAGIAALLVNGRGSNNEPQATANAPAPAASTVGSGSAAR